MHLVCANQIGMESCEATNKPDSYEAVDHEKISKYIVCCSFPNISLSIKNEDPRKPENV
jgi:hypothetical protein